MGELGDSAGQDAATVIWRVLDQSIFHLLGLMEDDSKMLWEGAPPTDFDGSPQAFQLNRIVDGLADASNARNVTEIEESLNQLDLWQARHGSSPYPEIWRRIIEALRVLKTDISKTLFTAPSQVLIAIPAILTVQEELIAAVKQNPQLLFSISSRNFEELVAEIFRDQGFTVQLTQATRDEGRDIIAIQEVMGIRSKFLIECKRYAPERKVGLAVVQRLFGVTTSEGANKAIVATTSGFTRAAKQFAGANLWQLDLKGYEHILQWISSYHAA